MFHIHGVRFEKLFFESEGDHMVAVYVGLGVCLIVSVVCFALMMRAIMKLRQIRYMHKRLIGGIEHIHNQGGRLGSFGFEGAMIEEEALGIDAYMAKSDLLMYSCIFVTFAYLTGVIVVSLL